MELFLRVGLGGVLDEFARNWRCHLTPVEQLYAYGRNRNGYSIGNPSYIAKGAETFDNMHWASTFWISSTRTMIGSL